MRWLFVFSLITLNSGFASSINLSPEEEVRHFFTSIGANLSKMDVEEIQTLVRLFKAIEDNAKSGEACARTLLVTQTLVSQQLFKNKDEIENLKKRVLRTSQIENGELESKLIYLVYNFITHEHRIRRAPYFDGELIANNFLRGIVIWAGSYEDIYKATEVFYHAKHKVLAKNPKAIIKNDLDLQYFAARMNYLAYAYDNLFAHVRSDEVRRFFALGKLAEFDATMGQELHFHYNPKKLKATRSLLDPIQIPLLTFQGYHLPSKELTQHTGLQFNNGLQFNPDNLSDSEQWAIRKMSAYFSHERVLGAGDQSSRLFTHMFRIADDGSVIKLSKSADFLFLTPEKSTDLEDYKDHYGPKKTEDIKWSFVIRELKMINPTDDYEPRPGEYTPKAGDAVKQMASSSQGLCKVHQDKIPTSMIELAIPKKLGVSRALEADYSIGPAIETDSSILPEDMRWVRSPLLKDGHPVTVETCPGKTLSVTVLELPIPYEKFRRLKSRK